MDTSILKRRAFLLLPLAAFGKEPSRAPVDPATLENLAHNYNLYIDKLKQGLVDVKQWERVEKAWKELR